MKEHCSGIARRVAAWEERQIRCGGWLDDLGEVSLTGENLGQSGCGRNVEIPMQQTFSQVGVNEQYPGSGLSNRDRQVRGSHRLAVTRHSAGDENGPRTLALGGHVKQRRAQV